MSAEVRERVSRTSVRASGSMSQSFRLSAIEIAAMVGAGALLVATLIFYTTSLRPEQERLKAAQAQYELQRAGILESKAPSSADQPSPAARAKAALDSLALFKSDHLTAFDSGRIALINELNALVKKHGIQLTSGIEMSTGSGLDESSGDSKRSKGGQRKAGDLENVYPNLTVRTTVFGPYDKLRSFVADIERNKQLVLINSLGLVNQEARLARGARGGGASGGIALTIAMQAYFRPPSEQ